MRFKLRSAHRLISITVLLAIVSTVGSARAQGPVISLDYSSALITPFPDQDKWSGISIAIEDYAWLKNNKVKPIDKTEVDRKTQMLTFSRGYTFLRGADAISYHIRRSVDPREFNEYRNDRKVSEYWVNSLMSSIAREEKDKAKGLIRITVPIKFPKLLKSMFGEGGASLQVNGFYKVTFEGRSQWDNRTQIATYKQSKFPALDMEQVSSFKITGTIGSKIEVTVDQDSKRQTDLDNRIQIRYKGTEDDIIQTIEAGNTTLSLPNTRFAGYSSRVQGLFGIKAEAKLGNFGFTAITSQEKGSTEESSITAGAQASDRHLRDYEYKALTFFDVGVIPRNGLSNPNEYSADFFPPSAGGEYKIVGFRLYVSETRIEENPIPGVAIDFSGRGNDTDLDTIATTWVELERDKYFVFENEFYVEMLTYLQTGQDLACWMTVQSGDDPELAEYGDLTSNPDTMQLVLLKVANANSDDRSFYYEWKNVYYLGARNIDPDGIEVQIFKGPAGTEDKPDENFNSEDGKSYLELLGLDNLDYDGKPNPDGRLDITDATVFLDKGYMFFPSREPFRDAVLSEPVPEVYTEDNQQKIREATKYYITINTKQRQSEFSLGKINIIEGSEVVTLNGRRLIKDQDYRIYYELGRISFLSEEALDPNANVNIDFEYQPFIAAEKKTLFGSRLEYVLSKDFKMGTTVLFKSEKSTDRKPRIGQEESRYLVWDSDFSTAFELPLLTSLIDALPFVEASSPSRVSLSGEIAQSLPNPNTRGEAFIDDFEGAREAFSLTVIRNNWTKSSAPEDNSGFMPVGVGSHFYDDESSNPRGRLLWYNPFDEVPVTDIWDRDVRDRDNRTHTLVLRFEPNPATGDPKDSWGGIIRPLGLGSWDQTRTQYLEIRMKEGPTEGHLRVHIGEISEDIDGDGNYDTEDVIFVNDLLDEGEDTGLDGLFSANETDTVFGSRQGDPSGDDWYYSGEEDPYYYDQINGTENNALDPGGGYMPDTEDINGNKRLDATNSYYEWVLNFSEPEKYLVPGSEYTAEGSSDTWVTYRFPMGELDDSVGSASLERVKFARLMLSGFEQETSIQIATIELVSTRWLVQPLEFVETDTLSVMDEIPDTTKIVVAVINTEEHSDVYTSPEGVEGYTDKTTDVTEKEQSLLVRFTEFGPNVRGVAQRILYRGENYAGYRKVQVYMKALTEDEDALFEDSNTTFLYRFGTDSTNYYEYRTPLFELPKHDANDWVDISLDLDAMTQVKGDRDEFRDAYREQYGTDTTIVVWDNGKNYAVRGNPKMTNVIYMAFGVERSENASDTVSGELWIDELRVTDVRRDKGTAKRISVNTTLSDLGSFSYSYSKQDAYFRKLTSGDRNNLGSGKEDVSTSISTSINLDKLLPPHWGAKVPVSYSWSKRESVPRLKSGSDIVISDEEREEETTRSYSESFRISQNFNRKTKNWLWNATLNKFKSKFSVSRSRSKTPTTENETESYNAHADYDFSPGKKYIKVLSWTSIIPFFPSAISETQMGYLPSRITVSGDVKRRSSQSTNSQGYESDIYDRTFDGSLMAQYNLFASMPLSFNYQTNRDIRDPENLKFSFNPKTFKLGVELRRRQQFSAKYDPKIFKFLTTGVSFKSTYDENSDPKRNGSDSTRTASTSSTVTLTGKFDMKKFFGSGKGKDPDFILFRPFLWVIRPVTSRVDPISLNYSQKNDYSSSGMTDRPSLKFQFGLTKDPGVDIVQQSGGSRRFNDAVSEQYSAGSGIKFILGTKINSKYSYRTSTSAQSNQITRGTTFPDLSVTMGNLEKYRIIGWLFKTLSINSSFSRKTDESINKSSGVKEREKITDSFSPLLGFNFTWLKSIKTQGRYETSSSETKTITGGYATGQLSKTSGFSISNSYSFSSPTGFKIPLLGRLKFRSMLSLSVDVSKRTTKSEKIDRFGNTTPTSESTDLSISPRASYSFSSNIKGGMNLRWSDREDLRTRTKSHVRQVSIWVEIRF